MNSTSDLPLRLTFGRFRVFPERREVLADGQPIKLGGRAFDVLMALVEARGAVVTRETLIARVGPGRIIEENSLAAQIAALRAAFGAERALIRTVSGRGYQFTGTIHVEPASPGEPVGAVGARPASVSPPTNVPEPVSGLIGREEELSEILNLVTMHWLVTLTGAGGIGKTALALALARELRPHFADGVWLAEFSALADPGLVPATMVAAVGIELGGGEASAQRVARALADRRMLLVLDTCEHVITAAAAMAEAMLGAGSGLRIIATSREPLRAGGEWIYPVQPLAVPAMDVAVGDDPLRYGAVRLFIERARAAEPHFAPDRRLIAMIAAICRRLDGITLAIELAAGRASVLAASVTSVTSDYRHVVHFQVAPRVMAGAFLARTLWLQGDADQAARIALSSVEEARTANHANSLGYALSLGACLIALWRGDLDMADGYVGMLLDHSTRYGLSFWLAFGRCYQGQLVIRRGDVTTGLQLLRTGVGEFIESNTTSRFIAAQMAEALRQAGRIGEGLAVIEGAIRRSKTDEELWATAELLRIKGDLVRMQGIPEASAAAEDQFRQALELSRQQGVLSWELRAATSLALLWRDQGRLAEAMALLRPVYDLFTEGFGTADLKAAKALLDALQ